MTHLMNKAGWAVAAALGLLVVAALSGVIDAGPLDPPGAPAPTQKTLQEVEPRTPVQSLPSGGTAVHVISQPGSYYLTGNITGVSGDNGILIDASDVTLDLNGFALIGVPGSSHGIRVNAAQTNLTIRNGVVKAWGGSGIEASTAANSTVEDVHVSDNLIGFGITIGAHSIVKNCTSRDNTVGISAGDDAVVQSCTASSNVNGGIATGQNSLVSDCTVEENGGVGIGPGQGSTVRGCVVRSSGGDGIGAANNCLITGNLSRANGVTDGAGIHVAGINNRIEENQVIGNDRGIDVDMGSNVIVRNSATANATEYDIAAGNVVGVIEVFTLAGGAPSDPWANIDY